MKPVAGMRCYYPCRYDFSGPPFGGSTDYARMR
jgi:hypothetical protein